MTRSGATIPSKSRPGSDGNEGVLNIPQCSSIPGTSPSDCLVSYPGHLLRESTCLQRADWAIDRYEQTGVYIYIYIYMEKESEKVEK